ncbi:hypothetical protein [Pedobacter sp. Hv1]|uniref:hypothetical protein n=1 Tax=Pedobacter sp. Hv1 TaxID=1740090 RepID=UPI0006D8D557|nr:hypothetical protein [Pedobacter sp. Hv1]KQC02490.1 hypothetical protein AQF98_02630 [Pedobacter sp. Hv1]
MKKIFLTALTLGFLSLTIVSCQSEKKDGAADSTGIAETKTDTSKTTVPTAATSTTPATAEEIEKAKVSAPDFSVSEINEGFKEFTPIKEEYVAALAKKDVPAVKAAQDKFNAWATKASTWGAKLPVKENQKYIEYYEKLVQQWTIAGKTAAK